MAQAALVGSMLAERGQLEEGQLPLRRRALAPDDPGQRAERDGVGGEVTRLHVGESRHSKRPVENGFLNRLTRCARLVLGDFVSRRIFRAVRGARPGGSFDFRDFADQSLKVLLNTHLRSSSCRGPARTLTLREKGIEKQCTDRSRFDELSYCFRLSILLPPAPPLAHCKPENRSLAGPFSLCAKGVCRHHPPFGDWPAARDRSPNAHRLFPPALRSRRDGFKIPIYFRNLTRSRCAPVSLVPACLKTDGDATRAAWSLVCLGSFARSL